MIPHPMLSDENDIFGNRNGLKDRVAACRKRLRLNRIHRAHVGNQLEELFPETTIGASEFQGNSRNRAAVPKSLVHAPEGETSKRADEQEVGIT
jgi:hypothetical protein